jgi:hypothetical protein
MAPTPETPSPAPTKPQPYAQHSATKPNHLVQAVIDIRHPDLLHHIEGRVTAARALAELLTNLPAAQILTLATYIAERTNTGINTVASAVISNIERTPRKAHAASVLPAGEGPARTGR